MTRGRWTLWITGGSVVAAAMAAAIAIGVGWVIPDGGPSRQEALSVLPFGALLMLGVLTWLDQRIWPPARPLRHSVIAFRALLAGVLGLFLLFAAVVVLGVGKERPDEATVLPLPRNLTVAGRNAECGSEACSVTYELATPDDVRVGELTSRLWRHLEHKGWQRLRANASCRDIGWIHPVHQCLFVRQDTPGVVTLLLSTALDLNPTAPMPE
jgi:hypothetical protein